VAFGGHIKIKDGCLKEILIGAMATIQILPKVSERSIRQENLLSNY
jgi:hypothetical protein